MRRRPAIKNKPIQPRILLGRPKNEKVQGMLNDYSRRREPGELIKLFGSVEFDPKMGLQGVAKT
jgi:hypothetical protein